MKDAPTMTKNDDEVNANSSKYASLTAGLLARKGEAVPAAAAFTAEAIAQHIPARRLAQEAGRVRSDRHPGGLDGRVDPELQGARVVEEHRNMIEQVFEDRSLNGDAVSTSRDTPDLADLDFSEHETVAGPVLEDPSLNERNLPGLPVEAGSIEDQTSAIANNTSLSAGADESDDNWFDDIVSNAISDAEGQRPEAKGSSSIGRSLSNILSSLSPAAEPEKSGAEAAAKDEESEKAISADPNAQAVSCGEKASQVRQAIKSGKPAVGGRSAMRLDPRRFIRLSLAAQKLELTSQEVMIAALDTYLDALDEEVFNDCACMKKGLI